MKERPMLFSKPMVLAILAGTKTQTRRGYKNRKHPDFGCDIAAPELVREQQHVIERICPYGQPGDRLWVRENCQAWAYEAGGYAVRYPADGGYREIGKNCAEYDRWLDLCCYAGKEHAIVPSIHMPRWASRILLEIVSVRVERLQAISTGDCCAEGAPLDRTHAVETWYRELWESINGTKSWDANPWVWMIEFKVVNP